MFEQQLQLKNRIRAGEPVLGTFIKTPSMHVIEVLSSTDINCIVLDSEHAPFSIDSRDQCLLLNAARGICNEFKSLNET